MKGESAEIAADRCRDHPARQEIGRLRIDSLFGEGELNEGLVATLVSGNARQAQGR